MLFFIGEIMEITAKRCKMIWDELVRKHYIIKNVYSDKIGEKLLRVKFEKGGRFKPSRSSRLALEKHSALVKLYQEKLGEEKIKMNYGQRELPLK